MIHLVVLIWAFACHLAGIYLFTRGFLLTRLSLPNTSPPNFSFPATHKRAVVVLVDALRYDFIAPHPPSPPNPHHHNVLTLPRDLTATRPRYSFIFNAYSDPPTTTLQRIKAITTGSLPTFVDIGSNFGANHVAEDSLLKQLSLQRKKLAFMGDDTWLSVFPSTFSPNLTFPFDSFNVEDLHTVDNGIVSHLFPLLSTPSFDILIAHFLGVDHIGHRLGPDNPTMRSKLGSLNSILKNTIDKLPPETLLIVLGDHGMDSSGDHGGDGVLETSSGLWIYSKHFPLFNSTRPMPPELLEYRSFPGSSVKTRAIQQIDLVPSLALLLGIPIPYNNLGTVIPELFWLDRQGKLLHQALSLNAEQIITFLRTYRHSPLGSELDDFWQPLQSAYDHATDPNLSQDQQLIALHTFTRSALKACRSIWAQFNPTLICLGLIVLSACLVASYSLYTNYRESDNWLPNIILRSAVYTLLGSTLGLFASLFPFLNGISLQHLLIFSTSLSSSLSIIFLSPPSLPSLSPTSLLPLLHSLSFLSNSYTFWEDRTLPFLLLSSLLPYLRLALSPSTPTPLRTRILTHLSILTLCTRIMAISTVCREEQQPYCHVTFFASRSVPEPPTIVLYLILPIAWLLPLLIQKCFIHKTNISTLTVFFFDWVLRPSLLGGSLFWLIEWLDSAGVFLLTGSDNEWTTMLRKTRTKIAWGAISWLIMGGSLSWLFCPPNQNPTRSLIVFSIALGTVWVCTQLTGQAVLALGTIALLSYLQLTTFARSLSSSSSSSSATTTPLALLTLLTFYTTGHQASFSSIQWKAGFVLTENVHTFTTTTTTNEQVTSFLDSLMTLLDLNINYSYTLSGLTVILNEVGSIFVCGALGATLVGCWRGSGGQRSNERTRHLLLLELLAIQTYFLLLLLGSSIGAAILRRHLMVWKVFAPRFMLGVLELVVLDVGCVLGFLFGWVN